MTTYRTTQNPPNRGPWLAGLIGAVMSCLLLPSGPVQAAGLLIADGGLGGILEIKEQNVQVSINNGVAVTTVTQVFKNTEQRQVEALYTFPVPKGASVANFSMWINGKEMVGEVLEKQRAREIYNSYKRVRRDPGLLEQVDYKTFEMRIFPIGAGTEQKVQISYYQELAIDHDEALYVYPLATVTRKDINSRTTGKFAINVDVKSAVPITGLISPSHGKDFVVARHSENYQRASLETAGGSLARDVVLRMSFSRPTTGVDLITSHGQGDDGYFLLTLTAGEELERLNQGMDYVFVLDISGSMADDGKLATSRNSLAAFIEGLGAEDRFEVMSFNVQPNLHFKTLQPATDANKEAAVTFLNAQEARGGTNLLPAITTAYKYGNPDRTLNVVVLSDGMTEQGDRTTLLRLMQERPRNARVFTIGVGNEVNRPLLEQMAEDTGGLAAFASQQDDFTSQAKAFRRKLTHPVATDLQIDFGSLQVYDVEPKRLPNLYHGSPLRVYGRYKGEGDSTVKLSGNVFGRQIQQSVSLSFPAKDENNPEIERMWAWKRIDELQKEADRGGSRQNVVDEIVRLGEGYSIVSEYTSFLVLENDAEYQRWRIERKNQLRLDRDRSAQTTRNAELAKIRDQAIADLGPQPVLEKSVQTTPPPAQQTTGLPAKSPAQAAPQPERRQSRDFSFGSSPVGPVFVAAAWWLRRRKAKATTAPG